MSAARRCEGSDDRILEATLRQNEPAPPPGTSARRDPASFPPAPLAPPPATDPRSPAPAQRARPSPARRREPCRMRRRTQASTAPINFSTAAGSIDRAARCPERAPDPHFSRSAMPACARPILRDMVGCKSLQHAVELASRVQRHCGVAARARRSRTARSRARRRHAAAHLASAPRAPAAHGDRTRTEAFQTSVPNAILLDPESDSMLFEKNADPPAAPASLAKLMTLEYVFNEIKQGRAQARRRLSRSAKTPGARAGRRRTAPPCSRRSTAESSVDDLIHGIIVDSANDACIAHRGRRWPATRQLSARMLTKRAREIGLRKLHLHQRRPAIPDPNLRVTARDLAELARHIMHTYPDFYPYFAEREFTWNKIRQHNRNPLLGHGHRRRRAEDRRHRGSRLQPGRVGGAGRFAADRRGHRRQIGQGARRRRRKKLLEFGFHGFESQVLFAEGQTVGDAKVFGGDTQLRPARRPRHHPGDDAAQQPPSG